MTQRSISDSRQERLESILECLLAQPDASAQTLAARFGVSLMTVHRDLDELQRRGIVRKFRGGVSVQRTSTYEITATLRRLVAMPQKRAIAAAAARLVEPGQSLLLDDSTTAATMLEHLLEIEDLHLATNYLPTLTRVAADGRVCLTAVGGTYDTGHESFLGVAAVSAIRGLRVDTVFFSSSSADTDGIYHQEESIVAVKAEMLRSARRRVLLMDASKLGGTSLHLVRDWSSIDDVVTDSAAPQELVDTLRSRGVSVTVVAPDHGDDHDPIATNEEK
ncbi:DeoR/GlpR transcriptional regulator [Rhodococcus sp. ABRD24]|uniref:DeoR/GlpR family DNA-binding transcription regulator n=1 Tax=Rhodococcus sp. ABRD24 TaxID=2507582 RepID=UPI00103FD0CB|nr:DeoR/GlpR family DNA-binding transcription regulator [Rhodococcus sp. ABRD24]QBJ96789.1 DeoR/GlpR transcriptional regulator [Rhodococcus sp. ABRD24]